MSPPDPKQPSTPRHAPREVEQSIKARGNQLYQAGRGPVLDALPLEQRRAVSKPFSAYLAETPAWPMSPGARLALTAVGVLVAALLVASVVL